MHKHSTPLSKMLYQYTSNTCWAKKDIYFAQALGVLPGWEYDHVNDLNLSLAFDLQALLLSHKIDAFNCPISAVFRILPGSLDHHVDVVEN
jgi:hypothetical protein